MSIQRVCDVCGKKDVETKYDLFRMRKPWWSFHNKYYQDLEICFDCFLKFKQFVKEEK